MRETDKVSRTDTQTDVSNAVWLWGHRNPGHVGISNVQFQIDPKNIQQILKERVTVKWEGGVVAEDECEVKRKRETERDLASVQRFSVVHYSFSEHSVFVEQAFWLKASNQDTTDRVVCNEIGIDSTGLNANHTGDTRTVNSDALRAHPVVRFLQLKTHSNHQPFYTFYYCEFA